MSNYNNFHQDLAKENDQGARERLSRFYQRVFPQLTATQVDYNTDYGKFLQSAGVDIILHQANYYGGIQKQYWLQEKVTFKKYPNLLFEYEKKSGAPGWAISPQEKADFLLYYQDGDIYLMPFQQVRTYISKHLERLKQTAYIKTDNHNVRLAIEELQQNVHLLHYPAGSY